MWVKASGQLSENVFHLTTAVSSHLLVYDEVAAIIDTGVAALQNNLRDSIVNVIGELSALKYIFVTHAHFDHIGGVPYLRKCAPHLELIVSPQSAEMLSQPEVLKKCYEQNLACSEAFESEMVLSYDDWAEGFKVNSIVGDGDAIRLGDDVEVKFIATPGHSEDSVSFFVIPDLVLAPGEALGGYYGRDKSAAAFNYSYKHYINSINKLSSLDIKAICLAHSGSLTGELAKKFLVEAQTEAQRFYNQIKERLDQGELVDEIADSLLPDWQMMNYCPDGPFVESQRETIEAIVKVVAAEK